MVDQRPRTKWHRLFGYLLQELLAPVGLAVQTELPVSADPPKIDIIIIKRESEDWTAAQLALLPDGICDSQASHILLEFKYTESFNLQAIRQILGYETFYREAQELPKKEVQSFLVISKTPLTASLTQFGYQPTLQGGIYQSDNVLLADLTMLVLNELSNEPHNIYFKLFASRQAAKQEAVTALREKGRWQGLSGSLQAFLNSLLTHWFVVKGDDDMVELTPEQMVKASQAFKEYILPMMPLEERLADISPADVKEYVLPMMPLGEWLADVSPDDISEEELTKIPFIHHIEEKGIEQGIEKGERKATLNALHQTLTVRFDVVLGEFDEHFESLDLKSLEQLNEMALTVQTLAEFERAAAEMISQVDPTSPRSDNGEGQEK